MGSKKLNLTINPRIISHLGEALIDNEKVALLELIKNASDADAKICKIKIDTNYYHPNYGLGRLIIEDDGNGMTPLIIQKAFLEIATSFKKDYQKISPKFGRQAQGNKGIGRLALNQLGKHISIKTKLDHKFYKEQYENGKLTGPDLQQTLGYGSVEELIEENAEYYHSFELEWDRFDKVARVEEVEIQLETKKFEGDVFDHSMPFGTRIEVLGLKGISYWKKNQTQKEIEQDILEFVNPYIDIGIGFFVSISLDNQVFRSDVYDKDSLERSYFSKANFNFDDSNNLMKIKVERSKRYIDSRIDQLCKQLSKVGYELEGKIPYDLLYDGYRLKEYEVDLSSLSSIVKSMPYVDTKRFATYISKSSSSKEESKHELSAEGDNSHFVYLPGSFKGQIYAYDLRQGGGVSKEVRDLLKVINGIKLYRNNFRIFPYGERNNDWLGMAEYNMRQAAVIYKTHTSTGFVNIDGRENLEKLQELTNRQGLVLDEYGSNFLSILQEVVYKTIAKSDADFDQETSYGSKKQKDSNENELLCIAGIKFRKRPDELKKTQDTATQIKEKYEEIKRKMPSELQNELMSKNFEKDLESLVESTSNIESSLSYRTEQLKNDEAYLQDFFPLLGAMLVSETLSHEIIRLSNNIKIFSTRTRQAVISKNQEDALKNLTRIDTNIKFLSRYASLLDTNSSTRRRRYKIVNIIELVNKIVADHPLLDIEDEGKKVRVKIIGDEYKAKVVEESFRIILENLLINSIYWLHRMEIKTPEVVFEFEKKTKKLYVYDNGVGIDKEVENHIFDAFVTRKPLDQGRGMGLYIVRNLLEEIGAVISLSPEENRDGNRYKFMITFPEVEDR